MLQPLTNSIPHLLPNHYQTHTHNKTVTTTTITSPNQWPTHHTTFYPNHYQTSYHNYYWTKYYQHVSNIITQHHYTTNITKTITRISIKLMTQTITTIIKQNKKQLLPKPWLNFIIQIDTNICINILFQISSHDYTTITQIITNTITQTMFCDLRGNDLEIVFVIFPLLMIVVMILVMIVDMILVIRLAIMLKLFRLYLLQWFWVTVLCVDFGFVLFDIKLGFQMCW